MRLGQVPYTGCLKKVTPFGWRKEKSDKILSLFECTAKLISLQHTLFLKIVNQTFEKQARKMKDDSAPETRGIEKRPSHVLYHGHFPRHL